MKHPIMTTAVFTLLLCATTADASPLPSITPGAQIAMVRKPTSITHSGDGSRRVFITEQEGRVRIVKNGILLITPFLDISDRVSCCGERGLLSIAFPPGYRDKRYFYVNYTDRDGDTIVSRFRTARNPDQAERASEEVLLTVKQPFPNHNGGQLAFGPDGYLYIGMGDGGAANDPFENGQNLSTLLGKLLRIDVERSGKPYSLPRSNPFLGKPEIRQEIWAFGLRNPWRFSFDRLTGDLYVADVGQNKYEEVNVQSAGSKGGENYGWDIMEGKHCFGSRKCDMSGLAMPVAEYDHNKGCSVTGGVVYRGKAYPALAGVYLYGDYCSGRIWGLKNSNGKWLHSELIDTDLSISTFGEDEDGEVYVADYGSGGIYRIEAVPSR